MTEREVLKLALEALKYWHEKYQDSNDLKAITAIEEVLAQPEQEPVAWMDIDEKGIGYGLRYWSEPDNPHEVPLYTTPLQRTWVGLTDEDELDWEEGGSLRDLVKAIEAKLKEKNNV